MAVLASTPERVFATLVAVDMVASTHHVAGLDPDDAQDFLDEAYIQLTKSLEREGGSFVTFNGDGGLAIFGWPTSFEDHADRACRAAWDMQKVAGQSLANNSLDQPVQFRVGIHSGLIGLRRLHLESGDKLDIVGGTAYLAAALQKQAPPAKVIVSQSTLNLCRAGVQYHKFNDPLVLGTVTTQPFLLTAAPSRTYVHEGQKARRYQRPLVGREKERYEIQGILAEGQSANRSAALIGEPGVGKSRLVAHAISRAEDAGYRSFIFFGDHRKKTTPFSLMRDLVDQSLNVSRLGRDAQLEEIITRADDPRLARRALTIIMPETETPGLPEPNKMTRTAIAGTLTNILLTSVLDERSLLVVEDVHLLDPESVVCLELLRRAPALSGLVTLITGRPEAFDLATRIAQEAIYILPMPEDSMQNLAADLTAGRKLPPRLLEQAIKRAEGIPFVLEQICETLDRDSRADVNLIPNGVESLIHARLNRLSPGAKTLAQKLSILGEEVELDTASAILDVERDQIDGQIAELEATAFVHPRSRLSVRFRHAIIAESCATTVARNQRRQIHKSALNVLSTSNADHERLAYHAEGAGDDDRALDYLWQAGRRAMRASAVGSLSLIFDRALDCMDRIGPEADEKFVDFVLMASSSLQQIGEIDRMKNLLPRVREIASRREDRRKLCGTLCQIGNIYSFECLYKEGLEITSEALEMALAMDSLPHIFAAQFMKGNMLFGLGRMKEAITLQKDLCGRLSGPLETKRLGAAIVPASQANTQVGWYMKYTGDYDEGLTYAEHSFGIAQAAKEPFTEVLARMGRGHNLVALRRNRAAIECLEPAYESAIEHHYDAGLPHCIGVLATALARSGQSERAIEISDRWLARDALGRTGRLETFYFFSGYAESLFRDGQVGRAEEPLERAIRVARDTSHPGLLVEILGVKLFMLEATRPDDPAIMQFESERSRLCSKFGLSAWDPDQ